MKLAGIRSQREVARMLGISHALVAQIERSAISKICSALDLPSPYEVRTIGYAKTWQTKPRGQR